MPKRALHELLNTAESAWPLVQSWLQGATNPVEVLPPSEPARSEAIVATQVTTRSPMGALIYETGGLLVDHGWMRLLGSGHPRLPRSLPTWNLSRSCSDLDTPPPFLLVADDVMGGHFAINGGALGVERGTVYYFAPDSLQWETMGVGYSDFLCWCLLGNLEAFYQAFRWPGWQEDVKAVAGDQGWTIYPPTCTKGPPYGERHRGIVPLAELYRLYIDDTSLPQKG